MRVRKSSILACVSAVVAFLAILMASVTPSSAQRLIPHQRGIEAYGGVPLRHREPMFANDNYTLGLSYVQYFKHANYLFVSGDFEHQTYTYRAYQMPVATGLLQVGYMHPVVYDPSRTILFYAGLSALGGYEELNKDNKILPDGARLLDRSRFLYGGAMHASLELFIGDSFILFSNLQGRFAFGTDLNFFRPVLALGFRINL